MVESETSIPQRAPGPYDFRVQRMEDIHDREAGRPDVPHRHDYYTAIWVRQGKGRHIVDFDRYELKADAVFFVSPGQVHQVLTDARPTGWVITFSKEFLQHNHISEDFLLELDLFNHFDERPPIYLTDDVAAKLQTVMELMEDAFRSSLPHQTAALSACLKLFLIYCESECRLPPADMGMQGGRAILKEFKRLVRRYFHRYHKVADYAKLMNISSKYLNQVVKSLIGQTAKEVIQEKIILNAKRELKYSGKSIKEIAYELGFEEPLYFSHFFKTCTGLSPTAFRQA